MKISGLAILSLLSLVLGSVARSREHRFGTYDDEDPLVQKSRVTAFLMTDDGLKIKCWEIGDLLPQSQATRADGPRQKVRQTKLAGSISVTLYSFAPSVDIFSFGATGVHSNAIDFRAKPNLFTVKDGLIFIEALSVSDGIVARDDSSSQYVFADVNGDDWFYFEDTTTSDSSQEHCAKRTADSHFHVRTISGSDTTLINFEYDSTPRHKVLHEGRCNFAGLKPISTSTRSDPDAGKFRLRTQEL